MDKQLELNLYRLTSKEEPTESMLTVITHEAAVTANLRWEKAEESFCDHIIEGSTVRPFCRDDIGNAGIDKVHGELSLESASLKQPYLIVIAGPNGSGKTTMATRMLDHQWFEDAVYINPDNVAQQLFGDWNSADAVLKAARYCVELRQECVSEHKSMVVETVFSSAGSLEWVKSVISQGYFVRMFFVATSDPSINASRVARRVMEGGHDVPIPKIISRYPKSILNCRRLSNIVDRLYVFDNSREGEAPQLVFRKDNGRFVGQYVESIPLWVSSIL